MSSHPRMNEWGSKDVDTFWTSGKMACCLHWCSLTKRNLTLSNASIIKTTVFEVGIHPWKATEWVDARIQPLLWSPLIFVPSGVKLNSQRCISDILEGELLPWTRKHFVGAPWTFQQDSAPSHGSRPTLLNPQGTVVSGPHPGVHQQGRLVLKEPGPESFELFSVVHPREQGLPIFSWFSRESEGQIAAGIGLDSPRRFVCLVCAAFQGILKYIIKNKGGHNE